MKRINKPTGYHHKCHCAIGIKIKRSSEGKEAYPIHRRQQRIRKLTCKLKKGFYLWRGNEWGKTKVERNEQRKGYYWPNTWKLNERE
jgi:hypothetical protein